MTALRLLADTNILVLAALKPERLQRTILILAIPSGQAEVSRNGLFLIATA